MQVINIDGVYYDEKSNFNKDFRESGTEQMKNLIISEAFGDDYLDYRNHKVKLSTNDNSETFISIPYYFEGYKETNPFAILYDMEKASFINDFVNGVQDRKDYFFTKFA